jgi:hypothetical protein
LTGELSVYSIYPNFDPRIDLIVDSSSAPILFERGVSDDPNSSVPVSEPSSLPTSIPSIDLSAAPDLAPDLAPSVDTSTSPSSIPSDDTKLSSVPVSDQVLCPVWNQVYHRVLHPAPSYSSVPVLDPSGAVMSLVRNPGSF